ncbi:MAG: T9SS type A sorting domain-containing protein [Bacteroidota bacterium]|nr:T9SS type A sorting domain-containing protein [Bacteroidota bacterium]MDP4232856.1 T9SS type A sorting domain-containing protein [Bacteroidota bacterium]MDP4241900.1 T9SS type A sorting domain-containing protein [Bacteroidota bacterium]MDP4288225.1 T9SS type A sorting domain-containing protein [Bacteroidota bacterium]
MFFPKAFRVSAVLLFSVFLFLAAYSVNQVIATSSGVIGQSRIGCSGLGCHGAVSSATIVKIWTDSSSIVVGQTYIFHFSVANPSERGGGCDISVDNGAKLATSGTGLQLYSNELTHYSPRTFSGDSAVWTFKYTPTKTGTAHIYGAGNAVNLNGNADANDHSNITIFTLTVQAPAGPHAVLPTVLRDTVRVGDTVTNTVWLHNTGTAPLMINHYGLKFGAMYSLLDTSARTIAVGDSAPIRLEFHPQSRATYADSLRIYSNDALGVTEMSLAGIGTAGKLQFDATLIQFWQVPLSAFSIQHGLIKNVGNGPLTIASITVASPSGAFKFVGLGESRDFPTTLSSVGLGNATADTFSFSPVSLSPDTAIVTFHFFETAIARDTTIMLIGSGKPQAAVAVPTTPIAELLISPNPSNGECVVRTTADLGESAIEVLDFAGHSVFSESIHLNGAVPLDLSVLPNGAYIVRIRSTTGAVSVRRIVIER